MRKLVSLIIALVFIMVIAHAQENWVPVKADNHVSVKFPSQPNESTPGTYVTVNKDSTIACIFSIVDFAKAAGLDSAALVPLKTKPEFTSQLKAGMSGSMPNVTLSDFTIGTYKGYTSYTTTGLDLKKKRYDIFMFIIGSKFYTVATVTASGSSTETHDKFLASLSVTP